MVGFTFVVVLLSVYVFVGTTPEAPLTPTSPPDQTSSPPTSNQPTTGGGPVARFTSQPPPSAEEDPFYSGPLNSLKVETEHALEYIKKVHTGCPGQVKFYGGRTKHAGSRDEGQWVLCEPRDKWGKDCKVISIGISNDWSFDEDIVREGCEVWAFDHTISGIRTEYTDKLHWFKIGVGPRDSGPLLTLESMMSKNGIDTLDILKFDAEGSEWDVLERLLETHTLRDRVKQFSFEIHFWERRCTTEECVASSMRRWYKILKGLELEGFVLYDYHVNPMSTAEKLGQGGTTLCCYELAMYNKNFFP